MCTLIFDAPEVLSVFFSYRVVLVACFEGAAVVSRGFFKIFGDALLIHQDWAIFTRGGRSVEHCMDTAAIDGQFNVFRPLISGFEGRDILQPVISTVERCRRPRHSVLDAWRGSWCVLVFQKARRGYHPHEGAFAIPKALARGIKGGGIALRALANGIVHRGME